MIAITPDLVKARQHELLAAGERSRRIGSTRTASKFAAVPRLSAVARGAVLRLRRDPELVPGPFAPCAC